MKISAHQLSTEIQNPQSRALNIVFIGMSGAGKTHWSKRFASAYQYPHVELDEIIGHSSQLAGLVKDYPGKDMAEKMGHYFGMPWTPGFDERERMFLEIEALHMRDYPKSGAVLDLTGSAIYHPQELGGIIKSGLAVYLETDQASRQKMFENYIANPKPVCWRGVYQPQAGETEQEALARCYPILLETRAALYRQYADVTLPFDVHKAAKDVQALVTAIKERL
jgi:shikimate kinase